MQLFVVKTGSFVLCGQFGNDEEGAGLFQLAVGQAVDAEQLGAAHLEPHGVDGVMHHPGLIGFTVAGDDRHRVFGDLGAIGQIEG